MSQEQENKEVKATEIQESEAINEQNLIEELQVIEASELTVGHAFHAFRFKMD